MVAGESEAGSGYARASRYRDRSSMGCVWTGWEGSSETALVGSLSAAFSRNTIALLAIRGLLL